MKSSEGISVVVISHRDDHNEHINTALRETGHAAHCRRIDDTGELARQLQDHSPHLVFLFETDDADALERAGHLCMDSDNRTPLLIVAQQVDEERINAALRAGARDLVSLQHIDRLKAVAMREIRNADIERSLNRVMVSADQFKSELNSLKQVSVEAIADVQEGIIVNTNPAWLELFGLPEDADLTGTPIMDICTAGDQPALKGGIVACQRGKWRDEVLEIRTLNHSGDEMRLEFHLENVEHDGDPAVRMLVKPDTGSDTMPAELLQRTLQRDQVTGFYNRQHFADTVGARLEQPLTGGVRALIYLRIDRFSRVTSDVGVLGTDSIVTQFAQLVRDFVQSTDIYGRFGGTMFAVMVERGNLDDVEAWAESFRTSVAEAEFEFEKRSTVLSCSIGICEIEPGDEALQCAVNEAEQACRKAREQGGNCFEFSESSGAARELRQDDNIWVPRIRGALMDNRFRLEHQPIAGLNKEIAEAYDILVRMLDDEGNTVLPGEFMPVAERTGLTKAIDRWVIGATLSFCLTNAAELLFVRLSRDSVLDETLTGWLQSQLKRTGVTACRICFEIDATVARDHLTQVRKLSEGLHGIGFRLAIEHFGRDTDEFEVLQRVDMEFVKIDGALMQGLHKDSATQDRVRRIVELANDSAIETVAERVQDANTMAVLWQLGVAYIQGNYVQKSEIILEDISHSTATTRTLQLHA